MSGGATGLGGYVYQQDYLAFRLLSAAAAGLIGDTTLQLVSEFTIEGKASDQGPSWDIILRVPSGVTELLECKNTAITKADRATFYKRVRAETLSGLPVLQMRIGWVTDRAKQGNILDYLAGMASEADRDDLVVPEAAPDAVHSPAIAVSEAFYYLCHPNPFVGDEPKTGPMPLANARALLRPLVINSWSGVALKELVENLASIVFETGTATSLLTYIRGHLTTCIKDKGSASDTLEGFLEKVGTLSVVASVRGSLRAFLQTYSAAGPNLPQPESINWDCISNSPKTMWTMQERLPTFTTRVTGVVTAQQGFGKTVLSLQAFHEAARTTDAHRVLRVNAELLEEELLGDLVAICTVLCGLGPTWLAVYGLDAIDRSKHGRWQNTLDRLLRIPTLTLLVTARAEVVEAHEWLQQLTSALPTYALDRLDLGQVVKAFTDAGLRQPTNQSLLEALRNPFLLWMYAKIATPSDMPLTASGEVTAFRIFGTFWSRRVIASSMGARVVGHEDASQASKRHAAHHVADRTRKGDLVVQREPSDVQLDNGIQMLVHEGVLLAQGTHAIRWMHDWLREYALIDLLVGNIATPGPVGLAEQVFLLKSRLGCHDHVVRSAALGGAKWVIGEPSKWGPIEWYIEELKRSLPGETSDVLAMLMEGPEGTLILAELPLEALIEAVVFAYRLGAGQWARQIGQLPTELFAGERGMRLLSAVTDYQLKATANG